MSLATWTLQKSIKIILSRTCSEWHKDIRRIIRHSFITPSFWIKLERSWIDLWIVMQCIDGNSHVVLKIVTSMEWGWYLVGWDDVITKFGRFSKEMVSWRIFNEIYVSFRANVVAGGNILSTSLITHPQYLSLLRSSHSGNVLSPKTSSTSSITFFST